MSKALELLLNTLHDSDARKRQESVNALLKTPVSTIADLSLPLLLDAGSDRSDELRTLIASALGKKRDHAALPLLIEFLANDSSPKVRSRAARSLGEIGNPDAIPALRNALFSGDDEVASEAGLAAKKVGNPEAVKTLIEALSQTNVFARRAAAVQFKNLSEPSALPALLITLKDSDPVVRRLSASALGNLGDPSAKRPLVNALEDDASAVRCAALAGLVALCGASAMPSILACWGDSDPDLHNEANWAMQKCASMSEIPFLLGALSDKRAKYRADAAVILGTLGDPGAVPGLIAALLDPDANARDSAIRALAAIGPPHATQALISALKSRYLGVRYQAAKALGADGYADAVPALIEALGSPDALIRATAAEALGEIGDPVTLGKLEELASDEAIYIPRNTLAQPGHDSRVGPVAREAAAKVKSAQTLRTIRFSACYPKEMTPDVWRSMHVYIFGNNAAGLVAADARTILGKDIHEYRAEEESVKLRLRKKTSIGVTPRLGGFEFNPRSQTIELLEDWHRVDFRLKPDEKSLRTTSNGTVVITVNGAIVADIPISIYVHATSDSSLLMGSSGDETMAPPSAPYASIFCSYSHQDEAVVKRVEQVCRSLGITYLRDKVSLRSGEHWSEELLGMIERADVFQLFWSTNAANSEFVEKEWRYAQKLDRDAQRFIRPVYWTEPMAAPPAELQYLHFVFTPEL